MASEWLSTADSAHWPPPPDGDGRPILLIPGFLAGDASLSRMASWLRSGGFRTYRSGIAVNTACMEPLVERLEARLVSVVERTGTRAVVLGQSRGGTLGRILVVRRPELVEELVTLGSPIRDQMAVRRAALLSIGAIGLLGTLRVPGCFSIACAAGHCCERARAELVGPFPSSCRWVSFYTRSDEIVKWEACLDPAAEQIEVDTTHIGMGFDVGVWRILAGAM
ncbi:MAG: alpha/beta hydrolase [Actinomycetota bacterium]|nr:alpha/beta hydrolase [Actinomycetota bacterium]